jgi:hypothetical protein
MMKERGAAEEGKVDLILVCQSPLRRGLTSCVIRNDLHPRPYVIMILG